MNATRVRRYPKREFHIQQIYVRGYPMQDGETPLYCHAEAFAPVRPAIHPNGEAQRLTEAVGKTSAVMYASGIAVLERECNE